MTGGRGKGGLHNVIDSIRGVLLEKDLQRAVVDVGGVGVETQIPFSSFRLLGERGTEVTLTTHLQWREDGPQLFGFATAPERALFRLLIKVDKVGPKLALNLMSAVDPDQLVGMILTGNVRALTALKGVGEKLASRLIVELKEPLAKAGLGAAGPQPAEPQPAGRVGLACEREAREALETLGYSLREIERMLGKVAAELPFDADLTQVVESALRHVSP